MGPKKGPDGKLAFVLPMGDKKLPGIAAEDIGRCAYGIFKRPELIGKTVGIAGEHLTGAQMAAALAKALGQEVVHDAVTPEVYRGFGFPGADDLGNMFQFKADFEKDFCARARSRLLALAEPAAPDLRAVARREQGADPARLRRSARARSPSRPRRREARTSRRLNATPESGKRPPDATGERRRASTPEKDGGPWQWER